MNGTRRAGGWRRLGGLLLDVVEVYAPALSFVVMFLSFVIGIVFRYGLNHPLTWPHEMSILGFIWTTMLGACYAMRTGGHVAFTLTYDRAGPRAQLRIRLAGNLLIAVAFAAAFAKTVDFVHFMGFQKTPVLRIPFSIGYFPYVLFMVSIFVRVAVDLVRDVRRLLRGKT